MLLTSIPIGSKCKVVELLAKGNKRRRLLDLGLIPGTDIEVKRRSPSGDPTAYLIRGTLLALRQEETDYIKVSC